MHIRHVVRENLESICESHWFANNNSVNVINMQTRWRKQYVNQAFCEHWLLSIAVAGSDCKSPSGNVNWELRLHN